MWVEYVKYYLKNIVVHFPINMFYANNNSLSSQTVQTGLHLK